MKASIVRIGNSRGIRIPKAVLEQCGFRKEVALEVQGRDLVVRGLRPARSGWDRAFAGMAKAGDGEPLDLPAGNAWDAKEWEW